MLCENAVFHYTLHIALFSLSVAVNKDISEPMIKALGYDESSKRWQNLGILIGKKTLWKRNLYFMLICPANCYNGANARKNRANYPSLFYVK